ncbi:ankyrin repeat-containing domain protein [Astrocystis sublimbata]|nr:ankyrin repeat-containing domain protein [Astrocystis sublimbata]
MKVLLFAGAKVDLIDNHGITAVQEAGYQIITKRHTKAHRDTLQCMFDTTVWTEALGLSLISKAVVGILHVKDLTEFVNRPEYQALVNLQDATRRTPLHWAAEIGNEIAVKTLLLNGASTSIRDCLGDTPLIKASRSGSIECVKLLLMAKADPTARNNLGATAMHQAAQVSLSMVKMLKTAHVPFTPSSLNLTPLDLAAIMNKVDIGQFLVTLGLDVNFPDGRGQTTIFHATICWAPEFVRMLLRLSHLDLSVTNYDGETVLHLLARHGNTEVTREFVDADLVGLDPDVVSLKGETALAVYERRNFKPEGFDGMFLKLLAKLREALNEDLLGDIFYDARDGMPPHEV